MNSNDYSWFNILSRRLLYLFIIYAIFFSGFVIFALYQEISYFVLASSFFLVFAFAIVWYFVRSSFRFLRLINAVSNIESYVIFDHITFMTKLSQKFMQLTKIDQEFWSGLEFLTKFMSHDDFRVLNQELRKKNYVRTSMNSYVKIGDTTYKTSFFPVLNNDVVESTIILFSDITNEYNKILSMREDYNICYNKKESIKKALDHINMGVWIRDKDSVIRYCNKYYMNLIGYQDNDINYEYPELDKLSKSFADTCSNEKTNKVSERYLVVKGKRYLYQFHNHYIPESDQIISSCYNVSTKDDIAQELQRSISAQSELLESTSNACVIFGKDRVIKFYNNAFCKLWDVSEAWLNNKPKYEHLLDKLRDERKLQEYANYAKFRQQQIELFSNLAESQSDFLYLPDGRSIKVLIVPHTYGGLLFSYEDITDKIALESSYNTLLDVQKATIENLHEAVCVFSESGRLRLINSSFAKMWKIPDSILKSAPYVYEILDHSQSLFRKKEEMLSHKQTLLNVFSKKISFLDRVELKDGSVISRLIVPLPDAATLISDLDITDSVVVEKSLREKNLALQEADRIKTEFLANVSYELRSPLTSILGLSESLTKNLYGKLNAKQLEYMSGIVNSAEHLMNLINDMIDLTTIDAGYVEIKVSEFNLYNALNSIIPLVKARIANLGLKLLVNADKNISLLGDETRIKQVLFKLLSNCIDYSHKKSKIHVDISEQGENIILSVNTSDIQDSKFDNAFGKNISMSIIKSFIELHHGSLEFNCEGEFRAKCILKKRSPELLAIYHSYEEENNKHDTI